jgi:hypothetical protein
MANLTHKRSPICYNTSLTPGNLSTTLLIIPNACIFTRFAYPHLHLNQWRRAARMDIHQRIQLLRRRLEDVVRRRVVEKHRVAVVPRGLKVVQHAADEASASCSAATRRRLVPGHACSGPPCEAGRVPQHGRFEGVVGRAGEVQSERPWALAETRVRTISSTPLSFICESRSE